MLQNPHVLLTFDKVHNPLRLPRKTTSEPPKMVRTWCVLYLQKWSVHGVLCTCSLRNVLRAATACTFWTSELPKVVREWCALYILTWKCASRHNGVHFFDVSTSKSGPKLVCFVHFDLEMCFAPQRRAIFHLSSGQLAPHPPLSRAYFSTLRSHKPLEKRSVSRLSYLFAHLHLLSSDTFSSTLLSSNLSLLSDPFHLCFSSVHIALTSKLPSIIIKKTLSSPVFCIGLYGIISSLTLVSNKIFFIPNIFLTRN